MKILVTGSAGFINGYLIQELLDAGYTVVGLDNFSKYGRLEKSYDTNPNYHFVEGNAKDKELINDLLEDCDHFVASAAMIGGISYFHEFAYDLLAENERITAAAFDAAIRAHKHGKLQKITVVSSSMVFENTAEFPTPEGAQRRCPPPSSTYGFQKLATEYFTQGAWEQYRLPFTIARPFNCVGVGEKRALMDHDIMSGNVKLAMSPRCARPGAEGAEGPGPAAHSRQRQPGSPLHLRRRSGQGHSHVHRTSRRRGTRISISPLPRALRALELAKVIWDKIHGGQESRFATSPIRPSSTMCRSVRRT